MLEAGNDDEGTAVGKAGRSRRGSGRVLVLVGEVGGTWRGGDAGWRWGVSWRRVGTGWGWGVGVVVKRWGRGVWEGAGRERAGGGTCEHTILRCGAW